MENILRKRFDLPASTEAGTVKGDFELDKHAIRIKGILLTADRDEMLFHRATVQVQLSGTEVFPEGYHGKLLMSGLGVAPKDRFLPLDLLPGNGILKVALTDNANPVQAYSAYNVSVYIEYVIDEPGQE